ncbi:MAG: hypothetical protein Q8M98_06495 [Candidatus Cloacimonadaceae bacterium]|nr:hypothetical protein [Candidatus Cloacimonadaceae bacterium]MDP3114410.1 hypothetical protein [Candidatus Cloacimonadaceae bacterium]
MNKGYQEIKSTLNEAEAADMIERVARFIAERHLAPAGILFLESVRPLHGIGAQFMYFVLPFAEVIFDSQKYQRFALMIENEENLKRLIQRIDEMDEEINRERRAEAKLKRKRRRNQFKAFFAKLIRTKDKKS